MNIAIHCWPINSLLKIRRDSRTRGYNTQACLQRDSCWCLKLQRQHFLKELQKVQKCKCCITQTPAYTKSLFFLSELVCISYTFLLENRSWKQKLIYKRNEDISVQQQVDTRCSIHRWLSLEIHEKNKAGERWKLMAINEPIIP